MYFASQAASICDEKANHKFFRQYKRLVRRVNRDITWLTARGKTRSEIRTKMKNSFVVLETIADDLCSYGYRTKVYTHQENNGKIYNCLETVWGHQSSDNEAD